jgi:putative transposase
MCVALRMSRQNYYRQRQRRQRRELQEEVVLAWTKEERQVQPKLGARKLLHRVKEQRCALRLGRDRYLALLKKKDLLMGYKKSAPKTTNSYHRLPVFTNRLKTTEVTGPNQAWVCDLTYIKTRTDFAYLFLLTDRCSCECEDGKRRRAPGFGESGVRSAGRPATGSITPTAVANTAATSMSGPCGSTGWK